MEAVYSVLEFLLSVPVGEMLAEYIVIIGVISLLKDEVTKTDRPTKRNGYLWKRNKNAPNNLERNGLSVDQVDSCKDFERKEHIESEFDTDLAVQKFSDKNSKVLKTDFVKERKQSKELHRERREGENVEIISNIRFDHHTYNLTGSSTDKDGVEEEHLVSSGQTLDEHNNTVQRKAFREISGSSREGQNSENMAQDDGKTKSLTSSDDHHHVNRLGNVYVSSGEEDSFYECENQDSNSPKAEKISNIASAPERSENLAKKYENNERRLSSRGLEPRDRPEERNRKPEETDPRQVALLRHDNDDNVRLWNEQLLRENDEFSCEITHMKRDFDQLRQENEQLKKDKKELLELMELLQLKKNTSTVERAQSTADLTDGSENFVREQPLGASSAEELSSPPVKEVEADQRQEMVASDVDVETTVQIKDQMRIQEREKRYSRLLFQFVFVGDSGVGKTSFIKRFCDGKFSPKFNTTVGVDFLMKTLTIEGSQIFLQIWDTAGQERFRSITRQYFRKADAVVVMYDVTSENSFKSVRNWMNSVQESSVDGIVVAVVGNKRDLVDDADSGRVVTSADGANLAKDFSAFFYECSAKTGQGLDRTMVDMASLLFRRRNLDDYQKQSSVVTLNKSRFSARRTNCCMTSRTRNRSDVTV